mmetsp:Transcript_3842/g.4254  ORF Transcript_3842/g.4254 Transcript_3842/m.4254 type:complete len:266 (-) Transcript_3842:17-814(-)
MKASNRHSALARSAFHNYASGLTAGMVSALSGYPLDVLRVRFLFDTPRRNLFNGATFTICHQLVKAGLVWPIQRSIEDELKKYPSLPFQAVISGSIGSVVPSVLLNPLNVIKVRYMESHVPLKFNGIWKSLIEKEGLKWLTRGMQVTVVRDLVWGAVYFPTYEYLSKMLQDNEDSSYWMSKVTSMACSAAFATALASGIDAVRLLQMRAPKKCGNYISLWPAIQAANRPSMRNLRATFIGVLRVTLTTVLSHLTYLKLMQLAPKD